MNKKKRKRMEKKAEGKEARRMRGREEKGKKARALDFRLTLELVLLIWGFLLWSRQDHQLTNED